MRTHGWPLRPDITYLNHGTVGVTPDVVLAAQAAIRARMEREPAQFLFREASGLTGISPRRPSLVREAAAAVAGHMGARGEDLVFVDNATAGVNAVLRSLRFSPGDEVLVLDHAYGAVVNAVRHIAGGQGARVVTARVPYPAFSAAGVVEAVRAGLSGRTRLAILDHVTSESALILPLAEMARVCRAQGVAVLADGAHAPGMLPLDLPSLGVEWYVANLHKWACAPRSCGFLWADPRVQADLHPVVISWGFDTGLAAEFDWVGTRDVSAWLAAPAGFDFLAKQGVHAVWTHNHGLAVDAAGILSAAWGTRSEVPESAIGFMVSVPVPAALGSDAVAARTLRDALLFEHQIEVQVHAAHGQVWTRVSAQVYNDRVDVERLATAVQALAARGRSGM